MPRTLRAALAAATLLLALAPAPLQAQCSDAGLCIIGDHAATAADSPDHAATLRYRLGVTGDDDDLVIHRVELDARLSVGPGTVIAARVPWQAADGVLGSASGPSDPTLLLEQRLLRRGGWEATLTVGARFGLDDVADATLPQRYQPSLGTTDALFGLAAARGPWSVALGYQLVEDAFTPHPSAPIRRGDDVLLHLARRIPAGDWTLRAEVQAIQPLAPLEVIADEGLGPVTEVPDSDRAQVNLGLEVSRPLGATLGAEVGVAVPLLGREHNLDGLQRALSLGAGVTARF